MLNNRYVTSLLYWIAALYAFQELNYYKMWFEIPQGIHFMRQTDSLSIIIHYLKTGMNFFQPGILFMFSEGGKAAAEFPIIYYLIACSYKLFGEYEPTLRIVNTVLVFVGFACMAQSLRMLIKDSFVAVAITCLMMMSLVNCYYANNFLPDAASMAFCMMGIYFFIPFFHDDRKLVSGIIGMALMILASLIKVPCLMYPAAFMTTYFVQKLVLDKQSFKSLSRNTLIISFVFILGAIFVVAWVLYIRRYNTIHKGYFLVNAKTYFDADNEDRVRVFKLVTEYWWPQYYPRLSKIMFLVIACTGLFRLKQIGFKWSMMAILSLLGCFAFFILFFLQFEQHDYYFLAMIPAIGLIMGFALKDLGSLPNAKYILVFVIAGITYLSYLGLIDCKRNLEYKIESSKNDAFSVIGQKFSGSDKVLDSVGVSKDAVMAVLCDLNVNGSMYFMRRFGYPIMDTADRYMKDFNWAIKYGSDYIVLTDTGYLQKAEVAKHIANRVYTSPNYSIYTIKQ